VLPLDPDGHEDGARGDGVELFPLGGIDGIGSLQTRSGQFSRKIVASDMKPESV
jgi:hypothetical protein